MILKYWFGEQNSSNIVYLVKTYQQERAEAIASKQKSEKKM